MHSYIIPLIFVISFGLHAHEKELAGFDPKTDIISHNYEAGPYLIYDCTEKHWVCVMETFYEECKLHRRHELTDEKVIRHSCSPVGKFPTKKSCFQRQQFMTTHNHGDRFCIKDEWKRKAVD